MTTEFILGLLNGNWAIASLALTVICCIYLRHEIVARLRRPTWITQGMRMAAALGIMSLGIFIRLVEAWRWLAGGGDLRDLSLNWLMFGGLIAIVGFLYAIREISEPLYGRAPWLCTLIAMMIFTTGSVAYRFW